MNSEVYDQCDWKLILGSFIMNIHEGQADRSVIFLQMSRNLNKAFREQQYPSHRSENDQPIHGPTVWKCNSAASTNYLANVFGMCWAHRQAQGCIVGPTLYDSYPFLSKSTDLSIPNIWLSENLTLKIQVQGHG